MALVMKIALPLGRYLATPWGRHVNEGAVEWPPSPWRIVRALTASWHIHHHALGENEVRSALELLCAPPTYHLPRYGMCVSRHYLPDANDRKAKRSTSLGLDAAIVVAPGDTIGVQWAVFASASEVATLRRLSSTVSYLGRAGSRVAIDVIQTDSPQSGGLTPLHSADLRGQETLDLLVPSVPLDWDAIHATTSALHKTKRTTPPSTRWVTYRLPDPESQHAPPPDRPRPSPVEAVQFAVTGRGRPVMSNAGLVASLFRRASTSRAQDDTALHGHTEGDTRPLDDDHRHAHYIVLNDLASGGRVDRLVIWVPGGMAAESAARLVGMRSLSVPQHLRKRLGSAIELALEYAGPADGLDGRLVGPAKRWTTLTPVTTTRHRKPRETWDGFVEGVVRRELTHHGLPADPSTVRIRLVTDADVSPSALQARTVYRARSLGRDRQQVGFHVMLEFDRPVPGPLALGSLSHFGLGTFLAPGDG